MGLSNTQYDDIMFAYDQTRMKNQRLLEQRRKDLYKEIPELKEISEKIQDISVNQAKLSILSPAEAAQRQAQYAKEQSALLARKEALLTLHHYPADYLSPIYTCPDCKDTGYQNGMECHCMQQEKLRVLYASSHLSHVLQTENFSTFREDYYDDTTINENLSLTPRENIRRVREAALAFVKHFDEEYVNLLFYGETGVGKTFLTHCIAKELLDTAHTVIYLTSLQLFDMLEKNKFHRVDANGTEQQTAFLSESDLLIIDDLGTELTNSFTVPQLYYLIEERHRRQLSTIISTNLSFSDLRERYSERIFSRFTGYYDFKQIVGNDIRIQKAFSNR